MEDRGELFLDVGEEFYAGMIIGERNKKDDLEINITKEKKLTNMRSSTSEATVTLKASKNLSLDQAKKLSKSFNSEILAKIIRKKALDRIEWHKKNNDKIVVVTASPDLWLNDWCKKNDLDLVSTRLEVTDGKFTGNLIGMNCFGPEKVKRVKEKYELENYEKIYAYGDSRGDKELLEFADYSDFKPFA